MLDHGSAGWTGRMFGSTDTVWASRSSTCSNRRLAIVSAYQNTNHARSLTSAPAPDFDVTSSIDNLVRAHRAIQNMNIMFADETGLA
jgi:N-acetyl-gamma-glutamylphosphate reductase